MASLRRQRCCDCLMVISDFELFFREAAISHAIRAWSSPAVANCLPSGDQRVYLTMSLCPERRRVGTPEIKALGPGWALGSELGVAECDQRSHAAHVALPAATRNMAAPPPIRTLRRLNIECRS